MPEVTLSEGPDGELIVIRLAGAPTLVVRAWASTWLVLGVACVAAGIVLGRQQSPSARLVWTAGLVVLGVGAVSLSRRLTRVDVLDSKGIRRSALIGRREVMRQWKPWAVIHDLELHDGSSITFRENWRLVVLGAGLRPEELQRLYTKIQSWLAGPGDLMRASNKRFEPTP